MEFTSNLSTLFSDLSVFLELAALGVSFLYILYVLVLEDMSLAILSSPTSGMSTRRSPLVSRQNRLVSYRVSSYRGTSLKQQKC